MKNLKISNRKFLLRYHIYIHLEVKSDHYIIGRAKKKKNLTIIYYDIVGLATVY